MGQPNSELKEDGNQLVFAADLLVGTGIELRALAESVDAMEGLVGNLVVAGAFGGSQSVYQLQDLDRLRQSLEGIADFLDAISRSLPEHQVDARAAAATLKLSDLSRRLAQMPAAKSRPDMHDSGEILFFEQSA